MEKEAHLKGVDLGYFLVYRGWMSLRYSLLCSLNSFTKNTSSEPKQETCRYTAICHATATTIITGATAGGNHSATKNAAPVVMGTCQGNSGNRCYRRPRLWSI